MDVKTSMVSIGTTIGSPARAAILGALFDGRALTATELARLACVSPATASGHLARLVESRLLVAEQHGRHRYYRIAGPDIAEALQSLARLDVTRAAPSRPPSRELNVIRRARLCYDHFAGHLGVAMTTTMLERGWLSTEDRDFRLTASGEDLCTRLGIDLRAVRARRRMFARKCLDWSERRPHLAGALGAALAERAFENGWVERTRRPREVSITARGEVAFERYFGLAPSSM